MKPVVLFLIFSSANAANILAVFQFNGKSHFAMYHRLLVALAERGHHVDVVSHFPMENPPATYRDLSIRGSTPFLAVTVAGFANYTVFDEVRDVVTHLGLAPCAAAFGHPAVQNLKRTRKRYDLVISEIFGSDCMLGFGRFFGAPTVAVTSSVNLPWGGDRVGVGAHPAYVPHYAMGASERMGVWERVVNCVTLMEAKWLYWYLGSGESNRMAREFFGEDLPSLDELAANTSLVLVNSHFSCNMARPVVPNFVEVGGLHIKPAKPLNKHFEEVFTIGKDKKGVVFLSMGSLVMTESFPNYKLQAMFDAFAQIPYKVVWKAVREKFNKSLIIPNNIHFEAWTPQMDILCSGKVDLFVSHGGLMGSQESIYCGVPRLGIPLFADQKQNIANANKLGIAESVSYEEIGKEIILNKVTKLLTDQRYKENVKRVSSIFKDRPLTALDTAIFWVEYVIRHKGAPHLRTAGADLAWYQYFLVDVFLVLISGFICFLLVLKFCLQKICRLFKKQKVKTQ